MQQYLFRNTGQSTFVEVALEAGVVYDDDGRSFAGMGTDVEDYDNDGWPDVIVTALSLERYALYRAVGRGRFEYASHTAGVGRATLQNSGWGTKFVDASFVDVSASLGPAFARPAASRGAAFADLDDDGDVDIVIANLDAEPTILRNDGGNANHWLPSAARIA